MHRLLKKSLLLIFFVIFVLLIISTPSSSADLALSWTFPTGDWVNSSPAIGANGVIYVGSLDSYIYAINPDGSEKWAFETDGEVSSSPAIGSDSTIYVGSRDGYVYAINPDGTNKWVFPTDGEVNSSPAVGANGVIYVGSLDSNLYAINPDGTRKWEFETDAEVISSPAIGGDGVIYVGSRDNNLYAINPDGSEKWVFETGGEVNSSPAIGADGIIYVGSLDGNLYAINPYDGTQKWVFVTGGEINSSPAIGGDGTIYVGSRDGKIYAINPGNGTLKWAFETYGEVKSSPAIGADNAIYVGSSDSKLYAINPGGTMKWAFETGAELESSLAIGNDGTIYVGSDDNNLYAISGNSDGIADSAWPMFHHGLRHSGVASNAPPYKPELSSPSDGATDVSLTLDLQTGSFFDPDIGDTHLQTRWQISSDSNFTSLIVNTTSLVYLTTLTVPKFALEGEKKYYWRVRFYDNFYSPSEWSDVHSFTTQAAIGDNNSNGIPDVQENDTVDMDDDNTADIDQTNIIKSLNTVVGDGQMGVSRRNELKVNAIVSVESIDPDSISPIASPYNMPLGVFAARLQVKNPGDTVEVPVYLSEGAPVNAKWYNFDSIHGWQDYSGHATFSEDRKTVMLKLKDGGYGDADGVANGVIVDPGGSGFASWVNGCVRDAQTGKIISNAEVTFKSAMTAQTLTLRPVFDGYYFSIICPGSYSVTVSAPGYIEKTGSIVVKEVTNLQKDFQLACNAADSDGDGITDDQDKCPDTPSGEDVDAEGCSDSQNDAEVPVVTKLKVYGGSKVTTLDIYLEAGIKGSAGKYKVWEGSSEPAGWNDLPAPDAGGKCMIPIELKPAVPGNKAFGVKRTVYFKTALYNKWSKTKKVSVSLVVPKVSGFKVNGNNKALPGDVTVPVTFKAKDAVNYYISGDSEFKTVTSGAIASLSASGKGGYIASFDLSGVPEEVKGNSSKKTVYLKVKNEVYESKVVKAVVKMVEQ